MGTGTAVGGLRFWFSIKNEGPVVAGAGGAV